MKLKHWTSTMTILGLSMALCCSTARAAEFDLDFETDPEDLGVEFFGTSEWREDDGVDDSGYLSISDALNDQRGAIVFPDLENGQQLTAFRIQADLRVGGGTDSPADGFSFNFARPGDPVLDDGEGWASSPTNEANLPEEGTTTGLAIGFDEWFSGGADVIGMSVRIDNQIVAEIPFPVLNGDVNNTESLQTMAVDDVDPLPVFDDELQDRMGFATLQLELCANNLTIEYKGQEVYNEVVEYDPSPGLLVFGGRTGGSNAYHHIDNISIQTGDDVGAGCSVVPPSFVAGEDTIGTRAYDAAQTNSVFGPPGDPEPGLSQEWFAAANPGNKDALDAIFDSETSIVPPFNAGHGTTWWSGHQAPFGDLVQYPDEVQPPLNDTNNDNYSVRATGEINIPESGTYRFTDGVDDYTYLAIDLDNSGVAGDDPDEILIDDNNWTNVLRDGNDGVGLAEVDIDVAEGGAWLAFEFNMAEGGGGDAGVVYWDYDPNAPEGDRLEGQEGFPEFSSDILDIADAENMYIPDTHLRSVVRELLSADLEAGPVVSERPIEFDVNGDNGQSDALTIDNPDPDVYTTILELGEDLTFQIKATGGLEDGERFKIVDVDQITGATPTITSILPAGQAWGYDAATGEICVNACSDTSAGDYNNDGVLDALDIDLQAAEMKAENPDLARFDHNNDGAVDVADRTIWVKDLKGTWVGDSNFDREFNSGDLVAVFAAGKYETGEMAGWAQGDWDGDMVFGSGDLVAAFSDGGYEQGEPPAVAAVPEPSSLVLALLSVMGLIGVVRRRDG